MSKSEGARYLDIEQLVLKLSMSRSSIYRSIHRGKLPKPTKINARVFRRREDHIDAAMARLAKVAT